MNKIIKHIVLAILVICVNFFPLANEVKAESKITLRVSTPYPPPEQSLASDQLVTWEKMVTERTHGKIEFQNFFGGSLGKPSEHLSLVSNGTVDIVVSYGWYTPTDLPLEDFDYVFPFGPTDPYILTKAMRQIYEEFPQFKADQKKKNITRIFQGPGETEVFLSKEPILNLDDFKGKKCKVIGKYFGRWVEALGAVPVSAPGTEVYTMMQTGIISLALDTEDLHYAYNNIEQAPYLIFPKLMTPNWIGCWINLDSLNKLPEKYQDIILRSGVELELKAALEINPNWESKIFKAWEKQDKFKSVEMTLEDRKKWANKIPNTVAEWANEVTEKGYPGWNIVKRYTEITSDLGHVWVRDWTKQ